jgi:hypothetical protein
MRVGFASGSGIGSDGERERLTEGDDVVEDDVVHEGFMFIHEGSTDDVVEEEELVDPRDRTGSGSATGPILLLLFREDWNV